ncbi:MAG: hypothetical protein ACKVII_04350 [Planctomycetales bacterium]|jgi:hypothetical protein
MPRIFYGNFDFEHELATSSYSRSKQLERLNAELSTHLLAFAGDGDRLYYAGAGGLTDFLTNAVTAGFPNVQTLELVNQPIPDAELIPWGWSRPAISIGTSRGWSGDGPAHDVVGIVNSRTFSFEVEQRLDSAIPGAVEIDAIEMLEVAIKQAANIWNRSVEEFDWLLKAEFGMSGRERVAGTGAQLEGSQAGWIRRRLNSGDRLYFEPRVEPLCELSSQWLVPRLDSGDGLSTEPDLIGMTQLLVDRCGQYLGSILVDELSADIPSLADVDFSLSRETLDHLLQGARSVAKATQQSGYHGPIGIDSMVYRGLDGQPAARPIQDVNARLTMGRIALEWFRRFAKTDRPAWLLVSEAWLNERGIAAALDNPAARLTSSRSVAGHPVRRVGVLIDNQNDWRNLLTTDLRP